MSGAPPRATGVEVDEDALAAYASDFGRLAVRDGRFVALYGPLGAGKSTFARAACRGAGVVGPVPSPTFTLWNRHKARAGVVWHADLYRLRHPDELLDAGWPALLERGDAVFVEWAERAGDWLPPERWEVWLDFTTDTALRLLAVSAAGGVPEPPVPEARADDADRGEASPC